MTRPWPSIVVSNKMSKLPYVIRMTARKDDCLLKDEAVLSQEKRYDRLAQDMTQMPDKEDSIELFFSHINPLPQGKYLLNLDEKQVNTRPHLTIDPSQTFFERAGKNWYCWR